MTESPRYIVNFHPDQGEGWQDEETLYIPRVGDRLYPYEHVKGVFEVEEVWELGEGTGAEPVGTHVFVKKIPMAGTRLHQLHPDYYTGD